MYFPGPAKRISQTLHAIIVICLILPWEIFTFPALFCWNLPRAYRVLREYGAGKFAAIKGAPLQCINLIYLDIKGRV